MTKNINLELNARVIGWLNISEFRSSTVEDTNKLGAVI